MSTEQTTPEVTIDKEENHSLHIVGKDGGYTCAIATVYCDPLDESSYHYAELIKEAFNIHHETGLTPRQLLEMKNTLIDTVKEDGNMIAKLALLNKELKEQRDELLKTMEKIKTMTTNAGIKFIINKAIGKQD